MATRTIVTSQPDVACDVCTRRLLRGEQHDVFVVAGRRRTVCELCAPRAVHEGWQRESELASLTLPPMRPRRGRGLFQRLLQVARPPADEPALERRPELAERDHARAVQQPDASYELLEALDAGDAGGAGGAPAGEDTAAPADLHLQHALSVFNASEYPRRVAGVARSLGPPAISVRSAEHLASVVRIAVAWELCWYRYEVDLSEEELVTRSRGQGTELSELDREELEPNAQADADGSIALTA